MKTKGKKGLVGVLTGFREATVLTIDLSVIIILSISSPYFLRWTNIRSLLVGLSCNAILAIGMTMVMAVGDIDISLGAILGMAGAIVGVLYINGCNIAVAIAIALIAGLVAGIINGIIISCTKINSMICSLGMMSVCTGITYVITKGSSQSLGNSSKFFSFIGSGSIGGVFPVLFLEFFILACVVEFMMRKSKMVRKVFYVGSNMQAAIYSGINAKKVKVLVFAFAGLVSAFAGILTTARLSVASPAAGGNSAMTAISAAVIGGASMSGGSGSVLGTTLALVLLTLIDNALVLLGVNVYWQTFISGLILLAAVLIDDFSRERSNN